MRLSTKCIDNLLTIKPFQTRSLLADPVAVRVAHSHLRPLRDLHSEGGDVDAEVLGMERLGGKSARGRVSLLESAGAHIRHLTQYGQSF